jgi:hypothetical protein
MSVFSPPVRLDFNRLEAYLTQRRHAANVREVAALRHTEDAAYDSYLSYCSIVGQKPLSLDNWRYHQAKLFGSFSSGGARWKDLRESAS